MKYIYLDEFYWVNLLRAKQGKQENFVELLHQLENLNSNFCIPLSYSNVDETLRRKDESKRNELLRFQIEISKGSFIAPWTTIIPIELRNYIRNFLSRSSTDIKNFVFGKTLAYFHGAFNSTNPMMFLIPAHQSEHFEYLFRLFTSHQNVTYVRDTVEQMTKNLQSTLNTMIIDDYNQKDRIQKVKIAKKTTYSNLINMFFKELDDFYYQGKLSSEDLKIITDQFPYEDAEILLSDIPTFYTFSLLNYTRNTSRKIKQNDFYDLQLSLAIPYCDAVMTERHWTSIAQLHKLDKKFNTMISQKPEDLLQFLKENR